MRAGLSDRRPDAGDAGGRQQRLQAQARPRGGQRLPYCGVGCQLTYHIKDDKLLYVTGRNGPANENRLCVKGRFGFDYVHNPQRLMKPMIRKDGVPKVPHELIDPSNPWTHFREATWDEALDRAAAGLKKIRDRDGPKALAGFGSAKGSNEEAYLFQKLVRTGFGTNNVDHCTRLCHASSVAALMEGVGSGAVSATFNECKNSDVIVVIGANPTENHPVAATFFKQAKKRGATLIVMDPRGQALKRHATQMLQFKNGTDVAMLNGMLNTIVAEKLYDEQYIQTYVEGFKAFAESIKDYTPEEMAPICGIEADVMRTVARKFARAKSAIIFWGMGISQHTHGTDNARCLIALSLITGQIGRPGTGLHPLRGQNNVQGASDAGLIPMFFPDYKSVEDPQIRARFEDAWGDQARSEEGPDRGRDHGCGPRRRDQGHVHHGREPGDVGPRPQSCARGAGAPRASGGAGPLPHRDRGLCRCGPAGLGLAGEGRHRDQHQSPGADGPPGAAAAGRGAPGMVDHPGDRPPHRAATGTTPMPGEIYTEMASLMPSLDNISWERVERESAVTYPADAPDQPGHDVVFDKGFPRPGGFGKLVAAKLSRRTRRRTRNIRSFSPPAASSSIGTPAP